MITQGLGDSEGDEREAEAYQEWSQAAMVDTPITHG